MIQNKDYATALASDPFLSAIRKVVRKIGDCADRQAVGLALDGLDLIQQELERRIKAGVVQPKCPYCGSECILYRCLSCNVYFAEDDEDGLTIHSKQDAEQSLQGGR